MHSSEGPLLLLAAPLGNLADYPVCERAVERVMTTSDALARRVLRFETSRGDIGLRLGAERFAADGDVIFADDARVIALEVTPDDVLVCRPASIAQALAVGHALGNRHLAMQLDGAALIVRYDRLVEELFGTLGVEHARERRKLDAAFRHAHAPHGHS